MGEYDVRVAVLRVVVSLPGARSLKDKRQVLRSVRDRLRHRFEVSCHELPMGDRPGTGGLVITTAGQDAGPIRQTMDRIAGMLHAHPSMVVTSLDIDVFPWHPAGQDWARFLDPEPDAEDDYDG